jgi:hypothetical protein
MIEPGLQCRMVQAGLTTQHGKPQTEWQTEWQPVALHTACPGSGHLVNGPQGFLENYFLPNILPGVCSVRAMPC